MSRPCDAHRCGTTVRPGMFLCSRHWRMVPPLIQGTINARHRACRADFAFLSDVAYLQACVDAINVIAQIEGYALDGDVGQVSAYGRLLSIAKKREAGNA